MNAIIKVGLAGAVLLGAAWYAQRGLEPGAAPPGTEETRAAETSQATLDTRASETGEAIESSRSDADAALQQAYSERARSRQLRVGGTVERLLPDDRDGSPHQRFIIATNGGHSLLVAHNIELAPRLDGLRVGDAVTVFGEYEWNDQGGVMHWTHDDPGGNHVAGYIDWQGRRFQ